MLSIVLVAYESRELLTACLAALAAHPPEEPCETIVVDNASDDGTPAMVRARFSGVQLIENPSNVGFARAANQGAAAAHGDLVCFLNPDAEVTAGALTRLAGVLRAGPAVGAVGPRTVRADGVALRSCFRFPTLVRPLLDLPGLRGLVSPARVRLAYEAWDSAATRDVDWVSGGCLMTSRAVLERVGAFDEAFFMYFEDADFCRRLHRAGLAVRYVGAATVVHHTRGSTGGRLTPKLFEIEQRSRVHYVRKHYGRAAALAVRGAAAAAALARIGALARPRAVRRSERLRMNLRIVRDAVLPERLS